MPSETALPNWDTTSANDGAESGAAAVVAFPRCLRMPRWIVVAAGTANSNLDTVPASDEAEADTAAVVVGSDGGGR